MKQIKFFVTLALTLIFLTACQSSEVSKQLTIKINDVQLDVEVVSTLSQTAKGLSGRESMCWDCGMLFEFSDYKIRKFWMKDMQFPLDIIWIKDNQIVGIERNVAIFTSAGQISQVQSSDLINKVLEVNSGWVESHAINKDDVIEYLE